jgi:hypothetical protein
MAPEPQEEIGRLERIDPENGDSVGAPPASGVANGPRGPRDGLTVAIALAVLLSLTSIVAIGGLVAISMQTVTPGESTTLAPVDSSAPGPTIRVGEVAQGADERKSGERKGDGRPTSAVEEPPSASGVPSPASDGGGTGTGGGKGGNGDSTGGGGKGGATGPGGAWCDARQGGSCDAVPGGVLQPVDDPIVDATGAGYEGDGYKPTDEDWDDESEEDVDEDPSDHSGSGSSHPGGKR